jgi:hypothetical protein
MRRFGAGPAALCVCLLLQPGCLVQQQCSGDTDCATGERCDALDGQCRRQCSSLEDCFENGMNTGLQCIEGSCRLPINTRAKSLSFCHEVANPKSAYHNQELCLEDLKGKVVILIFNLLGCTPCGEEVLVIQDKMLDPLRSEGLADLEAVAVTIDSTTWEDRVPGFDSVSFPVMPAGESTGYIWGVDPHNLFLVDREGLLVLKEPNFSQSLFSDDLVNQLNRRIREIHDE